MSTIAIPLSKLRLSPLNVRHPTDGDIANEVHDLQASILAHGLMNPLVVHKLSKPRGHFGVIAGGRRLRALQGLAVDGRIEADKPIDCYETSADDNAMTEMSIAENLVRVALKPTAEYEAFAKLAAAGADEAAIAERFAVTILHVRQRMRLGRLHPDILAALDESKITLDQAKAYASTEDQALQARVFAELRTGYNHYAYNIRNAIRGAGSAYNTEKMLDVVGTAAYTAAGGTLEEDLFESGFRVVHPGTLADLYYAKIEDQSGQLTARFGAGVTITTSGTDLGRPLFPTAELSEEQRDRLAAIDKRAEEIEVQFEQLAEAPISEDDEDQPLVAVNPAKQGELDALRAEMAALQDEGEAIHDAAAIELPEGPVTVWAEPGADGMRIRGYYRPRGFLEEGATSTTASGGQPPAASLDKPIGLDPNSGFGDPKPAVKAEHGLTADALEVMRSHRRQVLRAMMVDRDVAGQRIAALYLPFTVLKTTLGSGKHGSRGMSRAADVGIAQGLYHLASPPIIDGAGEEVAAQPGAQIWRDAVAHIEAAEWMKEGDLQRAFALFCELDEEEQEFAGAIAAGLLLDRSLRAPGYAVSLHDQLAFAVGAAADSELRERYWRPDVAFFDRWTKARKLAAVAEISERASKVIAKMPMADISAACARFFAAEKDAVAEFQMVDVQAKYARLWMPEFLRFDEGPSDVQRAKNFKVLEEKVAA